MYHVCNTTHRLTTTFGFPTHLLLQHITGTILIPTLPLELTSLVFVEGPAAVFFFRVLVFIRHVFYLGLFVVPEIQSRQRSSDTSVGILSRHFNSAVAMWPLILLYPERTQGIQTAHLPLRVWQHRHGYWPDFNGGNLRKASVIS